MTKFESDLLKTDEDRALHSRRILETFVWFVPPTTETSTIFCDFVERYFRSLWTWIGHKLSPFNLVSYLIFQSPLSSSIDRYSFTTLYQKLKKEKKNCGRVYLNFLVKLNWSKMWQKKTIPWSLLLAFLPFFLGVVEDGWTGWKNNTQSKAQYSTGYILKRAVE